MASFASYRLATADAIAILPPFDEFQALYRIRKASFALSFLTQFHEEKSAQVPALPNSVGFLGVGNECCPGRYSSIVGDHQVCELPGVLISLDLNLLLLLVQSKFACREYGT